MNASRGKAIFALRADRLENKFLMSETIVIPEDAPFTEEQRAWLSGFLSKALAGNGPAVLAGGGPEIPVTVIWGSQTGNSEALAKKLAKSLKAVNFVPEVIDMGDYDPGRLPKEKNLLVITSTYGDGEPPDNAATLYNHVMGGSAARMEGVRFSVLALGDSDYPDYCKCGIDFDTKFEELGAERAFELVTCDVDFDEPFSHWRKGVIQSYGGGTPSTADSEPEAPEAYGKKNPFPAEILQKYDLNAAGSERETLHLGFSLEGSGLEYEAGDALGVVPQNSPEAVDELLAALPFNISEEVPLPGGGQAPLREALISSYDIRNLTPRFLSAWQERSGSPYLRSLVTSGDKAKMNDYCWGRELIDLVIDHPADFSDGEEFVSVLKKLQPRLYSIASSPKAHPGEVHLTVAIVRYESHGRKRGGVCTTFLADRSDEATPGVFVHTNKAFRLPENTDLPVIMVGPGTGIAPFRAFLEEREASGAKGKNWLFFGNPYQATDYLYEQELSGMKERGVLHRLDLAFSRDQEYKIYVQDRMLEAGAELWAWLQEGAYFYVCGDASRMAKDVDAALHKVVEEHGGMSEQEALDFVATLKKEKRYCRDVY